MLSHTAVGVRPSASVGTRCNVGLLTRRRASASRATLTVPRRAVAPRAWSRRAHSPEPARRTFDLPEPPNPAVVIAAIVVVQLGAVYYSLQTDDVSWSDVYTKKN